MGVCSSIALRDSLPEEGVLGGALVRTGCLAPSTVASIALRRDTRSAKD